MKTLITQILLFYVTFSFAKIDPRNLRCLVCKLQLEDLNDVVLKIDRKKMVDVGNFRMDAAGNTQQTRVPAHRSQLYISETIEDICKKMDDYVRVRYKATGKLAVLPMMLDGGMNPLLSQTHFVTDDDLNKSLQYYCERIFEENEDEIVDQYRLRPEDDVMPDSVQKICFEHAKLCDQWMLPDAEDTAWDADKERSFQEAHGGDPYGFGGMGPSAPMHDLAGEGDAREEL